MRFLQMMSWVCVAGFLSSAVDRSFADDTELNEPKTVYSLTAADGKNHSIVACAVSMSSDSDAIYLIDAASDRLQRGAEEQSDGEFVLWKVNDAGAVDWRHTLGKMPKFFQRPRELASIVPLNTGTHDIMVVGQFGARGEWTVSRIGGDGKVLATATHLDRTTEFVSAILLPSDKGILMAGRSFTGGIVWNVDLDCAITWKQMYLSRTDRAQGIVSGLSGVTVVGDDGSFLVAGEVGKTNKFGIGDSTVWLMRCDPSGKTLAEATFPGRRPSVCALANEQFVVLYDSSTSMQTNTRLRGISMDLQPKWDDGTGLSLLGMDFPTLAPLPAGEGFVVGCGNINAREKPPQLECRLVQYAASGRRLTDAVVRVPSETILNAQVCCGRSAYLATRTKGMVPWDQLESAVFKVPLETVK